MLSSSVLMSDMNDVAVENSQDVGQQTQNISTTTHRDFYDEYMKSDTNENTSQDTSSQSQDSLQKLLQNIWLSVVGTGDAIDTPFGHKKITYADYTASGRALQFIEQYISTEVLPLYANTHTLSDTTGLQTTLFRQEAREIVKRSCRGSIDDTILFVGSGATGCIDATVRILGLKEKSRLAVANETPLPVVFIGPYEHHSNILPWKESGCRIVTIPEDAEHTGLDLVVLERELSNAQSSNAPMLIGAFSACSNVTGVIQDTLAPTALLRKFGGLSVWDYAASAAHAPIDMNPFNSDQYKKDVLFFSPHKMVGGVSTPGVLCIKKSLLQTKVPHRPGGGTVLFVTNDEHVYLSNFEEKEEGGTPEIVGAIRAGLAMQLRESVDPAQILSLEKSHARNAINYWSKHRNIEILGASTEGDRVAILSFVIRYTPDPSLLLHHNFVAALLNDLFGIQARAGCACAGPYVQSLMGISQESSSRFLDCIYEKMELVRPGMVRLNLSFFSPDFEIDFILRAVSWIASHGWKLLPLYSYVVSSGEFKHSSRLKKTIARRWLSSIDYKSGEFKYTSQRIVSVPEPTGPSDQSPLVLHAQRLASYLHDAQLLLSSLQKQLPSSLPEQTSSISQRALQMRWFVFPNEALSDIKSIGLSSHSPTALPSRATVSNFTSYINLFSSDLGDESDMTSQYPASILNSSSKWLGRVQDAIQPHSPYRPGTIHKISTCRRDMSDAREEPTPALDNSQQMSTHVEQEGNTEENKECAMCPTPVIPLASPLSSIRATEAIIPQNLQPSSGSNSNPFNKMEMNGNAINVNQKNIRQVIQSSGIDALCQHCFHEHKVPTGDTIAQARECLSCECVTFVPRVAASKKEIERLTKKISSSVGQAIQMFNMIKDGDRVLVGVSGGKDSLTLIHILLHLQKRAPITFHLAACTVDPQAPEYDPSLLKRYFAALNIPYYYISQGIMEQAKKSLLNGAGRNSICAFCSRMRRGILYTTARKHGYNVLALGQHLDDLSESFLMSAFYNGLLRTMKVNYVNAKGDVRIIRPLCLLRESKAREYAKACALPLINENCPACFEAPKERQRMKLLLAHLETVHPMVHQTLLKTMMPLLKIDSAGASLSSLLGTSAGDDEDEELDVKQSAKRQKSEMTNGRQPAVEIQSPSIDEEEQVLLV